MSKRASRRSQQLSLRAVVILAAVALIAVTINSLLPSPFAPNYTWQALLGIEKQAPAPQGTMQVHFIDVGNADAALIRCGNHQMLIDAGEPDDGDTVVNYLRDRGIRRLDLVVATHPHADHIGGMADVLEAFDVDRVLMTFMDDENTPTTATYERFLTTLEKRDILVTEAAPGQQYTLGEATVDVLGPVEQYEEPNNMSVVCRITFGKTRFLIMGDAEKEAETALLSSGADLRADVLKAGHHGSRSSTAAKFLKKVSPTHAVLCCGTDNRYGHPHSETLKALEKQKVNVWRTDRNGTVVMTTDGQTLTVETEKKEAAA